MKKLIIGLALFLSYQSASADGDAVSLACSNDNYPHIVYSMDFVKEGYLLKNGSFRICIAPADNPPGQCLMMHSSIFTVDQSDNGVWHLNHLLGLELKQTPKWQLNINDLEIFRNLESDDPDILPDSLTLNCE